MSGHIKNPPVVNESCRQNPAPDASQGIYQNREMEEVTPLLVKVLPDNVISQGFD